jgi:uncharacterized cupredoxin-like copper-binding protein
MTMRFLLLALALLALTSSARASPPDWGTAQEVEVRLTSFAFTPAQIELQHGQSYRLHLINTATGGHSFDAAAFFAGAEVSVADRSKLRRGSVDIKGGESVAIRLIAPPPGRYKLRCGHLLHAIFGMTGEILVR